MAHLVGGGAEHDAHRPAPARQKGLDGPFDKGLTAESHESLRPAEAPPLARGEHDPGDAGARRSLGAAHVHAAPSSVSNHPEESTDPARCRGGRGTPAVSPRQGPSPTDSGNRAA